MIGLADARDVTRRRLEHAENRLRSDERDLALAGGRVDFHNFPEFSTRHVGRAHARRQRVGVNVDLDIFQGGAGNEQELAAWLDLPLERRDPLDPLDAAVAALSAASAYVESLPPTSPRAATILGAAANLAKTVEAIGRGRAPIAPPDEVNERVRGAMATCVEHLLRPVREAAAKLARDRAALFDGLVEDVAPRHLAEIGRRVDAMLGASA